MALNIYLQTLEGFDIIINKQLTEYLKDCHYYYKKDDPLNADECQLYEHHQKPF